MELFLVPDLTHLDIDNVVGLSGGFVAWPGRAAWPHALRRKLLETAKHHGGRGFATGEKGFEQAQDNKNQCCTGQAPASG